MVHVNFASISVLNFYINFLVSVSGLCFTLTPLSNANGFVLTDNSSISCLTIPDVTAVTPLVEIQLTPDCKDAVENNQVSFVYELQQRINC